MKNKLFVDKMTSAIGVQYCEWKCYIVSGDRLSASNLRAYSTADATHHTSQKAGKVSQLSLHFKFAQRLHSLQACSGVGRVSTTSLQFATFCSHRTFISWDRDKIFIENMAQVLQCFFFFTILFFSYFSTAAAQHLSVSQVFAFYFLPFGVTQTFSAASTNPFTHDKRCWMLVTRW